MITKPMATETAEATEGERPSRSNRGWSSAETAGSPSQPRAREAKVMPS